MGTAAELRERLEEVHQRAIEAQRVRPRPPVVVRHGRVVLFTTDYDKAAAAAQRCTPSIVEEHTNGVLVVALGSAAPSSRQLAAARVATGRVR